MIPSARSGRMTKLRSAVPIALAAVGSGCATYRPVVPAQHRADASGAAADLSEMRVPGGEAGLQIGRAHV